MNRRITIVLSLFSTAVAGCLTAPELGPPFGVVGPAIVSIAVGDQQVVHYRVIGRFGDTLRNVPLMVRAADSTIASVVDDSTFSGRRVGSTTVTIQALDNSNVALPGVQADILIQVTSQPVISVTVTPSLDTLVVGDSVTLAAAAIGPTGSTVSGYTFTWLSANKSVATVNNTTARGRVIAIAPGLARITAYTTGNVGATASIIVIPKP